VNTSTPVQVLWNYCNVLREDGMSYGDYVEQLTYLLFLKMADERSWPPLSGQMSQPSPIPAAYAWPALLAKDGDALFDHYRHTLEELGKQPGTLALIFGKAQNKFRDAKRRRVPIGQRALAKRPQALQRIEPAVGSTACQIFPNWA
jgi:type I restriction enzyme M protein